jgi:osmotically-inducible protein OsmY
MEMSNEDLMGFVSNELYWDPKVDSAAIAVSADDGRVTLRGTVASLPQKREARAAAERIVGVISVDDQLEVSLPDDARREDADVRGDLLQALMLDAVVPPTVDAEVFDGVATLTGTVERRHQRDEAERVAATIRGVSEIVDSVVIVTGSARAGEVAEAIKAAFERNARLDADRLSVTASNGTVSVEGVVGSWTEHNDALAAAWAAPGVANVEDHIRVGY